MPRAAISPRQKAKTTGTGTRARRRHQRTLLKTSVSLVSESNFYTGFTDNISEGGIFVSTFTVIAIGQRVALEFTLPDDGPPICTVAQVRWRRVYNVDSDLGPGLGLQFVNLDSNARERIEAFVATRGTLFYA